MSRSSALLTRSAAVAPAAGHPHVERTIVLEREAAIGFVELHRRYADVEDDAVQSAAECSSPTTFSSAENGLSTTFSLAVGCLAGGRGGGNRRRVAIEREQRAIGSRQDGASSSRRHRRSHRRSARRQWVRAPPAPARASRECDGWSHCRSCRPLGRSGPPSFPCPLTVGRRPAAAMPPPDPSSAGRPFRAPNSLRCSRTFSRALAR